MADTQYEEVIYNCHIHTLTINNVPDNYIPKVLTKPMQIKWLRKALVKILSFIDPWNKHDFFERYAKFLDISSTKNQQDIFDVVQKFYPSGTQFAVMPMDMTHMGAGKIKQNIDDQHRELARLAKATKGAVIPFAAIDPRRKDLKETLDALFVNKEFEGINFAGIKLYPPLGYKPNNQVLDPVFEFADAHSLPVTAHCSRGGVCQSDFSKKGQPVC